MLCINPSPFPKGEKKGNKRERYELEKKTVLIKIITIKYKNPEPKPPDRNYVTIISHAVAKVPEQTQEQIVELDSRAHNLGFKAGWT